ncbi:MAG: prealbumin-like fold domain-containing protein [Chloroflexota bacterium]|nr:prealbumin-like fold domain-containing protein [Chloroflexota bacterium]
MRVRNGIRILRQCRLGSFSMCAAAAVAVLVALTIPAETGAQDSSTTEKSHSLGVNLAFPDEGVGEGEQLCVALFPSTSPDLNQPPLLSRCLDPGDAAVSFEGLRTGDYSVLLPGPGSDLAEPRYQGQLVATSIPDDQRLESFGIDVDVGLAEDFAGTTGRVQVSVFGCPAGTDNGANRDDWATECQALAGGVFLSLSGTGSINDAAFQATTGRSGDGSGMAEFTNLPPGAYELGSELPENVTNTPALFVASSIDGSLGSLDPSDTLSLRPTETVAVDVYLVLNRGEPTVRDVVGTIDPGITGGVAASSDETLILLD